MAIDEQGDAYKPLATISGTMTAAGVVDTRASGFVSGNPTTIASVGLFLRTGKGRMTLGGATFTATTKVRLQFRDDIDDTTSGWLPIVNPVTNLTYFTEAGAYPFDFKSKVFVRIAVLNGEFTGGDSVLGRVEGEV